MELVNPQLDGTIEGSYRVPGIDRALATVVGEFRRDCIHVQHLLNLSIGIVDAARAAGAALVLTLHDYWLSCPRGGLRIRADGTLCADVELRVCARCLAASPQLASPLQRIGLRIPVLASRTGGVPEILPDDAGVLVPPGDVEALRTALADLADGRLLAGALTPRRLKTTREGAEDLVALYSELRRERGLQP